MQQNPRLLFFAALSLASVVLFSRYTKPDSKTQLDSETQPVMSTIKPLTTVMHQTRSTCSATVFLMHGLGDSGKGWLPIAQQLSGSPSLQHIKWVLPNAPVQSVTLNFGMEMPSWYDISSLSSLDETTSEKGILESVARIGELVKKEIDSGTPSERIVVAGFSQGGVMALTTALTSNFKFAGVVVLSAYLPLKDKMATLVTEANKRTPILQCHGDSDAVVQYLFGKLSFDWLEEKGYNIQLKTYTGMGHSSSVKELQDVAAFLKEVLPEQTA